MGAWTLLAIAICLEVIATTLLKLSAGFEKAGLGILSLICYSACFYAFAPAIKAIPVGVAYAVWAGTGIAAITFIGVAFFGQKLEAIHYLFIALIAIGGVGLRLTSPS